MALTQTEWADKLKSWLPSWFYESQEYQEAVLQALSKILVQVQADSEAVRAETYISESDGSYLDLHGYERSIDRNTGEIDRSYGTRVQNLSNSSNLPAIASIVNKFLVNGTAIIDEDYNNGRFLSRGVYCSRAAILTEAIKNAFTVILQNQTHAPYSFLGRKHFMSRSEFVGELSASQDLFTSIVTAINDAKALGTLYRVIERAN